jgi:glutamine amidotransferase
VTIRIGVCDYGVGNLRSVERALVRTGATVTVSSNPSELSASDGLILPGVGAFGTAVDALARSDLGAMVIDHVASGQPLLGICLGFQLLFDSSEESGGRKGLALLPGKVTRIDPSAGKVPHMGWNQLHITRNSPLVQGIEEGSYVYFVHSYAARALATDVVATCEYGGTVAAICEKGNVMGTQFHPEKSGRDGLRLYENFVTMCAPATARSAELARR